MRVCYFYLPNQNAIFLVTMFAKNEKANLTMTEKDTFRKLIMTIKLGFKE